MYASHVCEAWALFIPTLSVTDTMKGANKRIKDTEECNTTASIELCVCVDIHSSEAACLQAYMLKYPWPRQ